MGKIVYNLKNDIQKLSRSGNKIILSKDGGEITLPEGAAPYDDSELRSKISELENKPDNDKQQLSIVDHTLSISNGNSIFLPNDKQTISKEGNKIVLSDNGGEIELPSQYDDSVLKARLSDIESKEDNDKQTLSFTESSRNLSISNGNSVTLPDYLLKDDAYSTFPTYAKLQDEMTKNIKDKHVDLGLDKLFEDKLQNGENPYVKKSDVPELSGVKLFVAKGDISGNGNSQNVRITKDKLVNADTIKVGDTVVDSYWDKNNFNIGMFKVTSVDGDNVVLNGVNDLTYKQPKQSLTISNRTLSISEGNSVELPSDNDTKYTAKGRGLFLDSDNAFHIEMGRDVDVIYPFNTNENTYIKLSPSNRYNVDDEYISYAVDNDGTLNRDAVLEAGLIYDFEGSWTYNRKFTRFSKQTVKLSICTTRSTSSYVTGLISYCFPKNVKFEANFESYWNYHDKVLFNVNPKIIWSVESDKHTEYYTHYVTKEELDSEEPIEIEVKNDKTVVGNLTITLKNTKVFIRSVQGNVKLKNPDDNLFYNMQRLN